MREILFRGFCPSENGKQIITLDGEDIRGDWVFGDLIHNIDCVKVRERETDINRIAKSYEVIPETVGQYTGLKDKNGMKMFEHDKLKDNKGQVGTIFYSETEAAFLVNWKMKDGSFETDACFCGEVIGTIFDKAVAAGETGVCGICGRRLPMSELNQWELSIVDRLRYGLQHNQSVTLGADEVHIPMNAIIERGDRRAQPENKPLDAVPVVRGEWIPTDMGGGEADEAYVCSACGEPWTLIDGTPHENNMNYCPNCGAKMEATP